MTFSKGIEPGTIQKQPAQIPFIISGVFLLVLFLLSFMLNETSRNFLLSEDGMIESASALGYLVCLIVIIYKGKFSYIKKYPYVFLLIMFFMFRELDFHKRFTTMGMFKTKFFLSGAVPFFEKLAGVMVILMLTYIIIMMIRRHFKTVVSGLKKGDTISTGILIVIGLLGVSLTLDGLGRNLRQFGITLSYHMSLHANALEEIAEFGIPIILLVILNAYFLINRDRHDLSTSAAPKAQENC